MADAPVVRNLNDLVATIGQGVVAQKAGIDQSIADNEKYGTAQVAGLDAKKTSAFEDITQASQNKGMFFSGFSPDQEAKYTSDTYLPALAQLQQTIATTRAGLFQQKNQLDTDVFNKAFGSQEQDRSVLADWNKMTAQQQFEASEADKQRVFTAQQNQAQINAQASQGAANRAASAASSGGGTDVKGVMASVGSFLKSKVGKDQHVSPSTWQSAKEQWVSAGGDPGSFAQTFYGYANTSRDDLAAQYGL